MSIWDVDIHLVPKLILNAVRASHSYVQFADIVRDGIVHTGECSSCGRTLRDGHVAICPPCWLVTKDGREQPSAA